MSTQTQAYRRGLIKTAGAGTQYLTSAGTTALLNKLMPGAGAVVSSIGQQAGILQDKATAKEIKQLGQGASFAIPGKAAYNIGRRRHYAAGSILNALKPGLGAGVRGLLGALIGAGLGHVATPAFIDSPNATQRYIDRQRPKHTATGAAIGASLALSPQIIGWLASWFAKPRTKAQQGESNKSSRFLKGMLLPGYAGYVSNLDARSAQGIADQQLAQQEAKQKQKQKEQKA